MWLKRRDRAARICWTVACAFFLAHVVAAFQIRHHWSHTAALEETARQTQDLFGVVWGGGLYFNYAFTILWIADAVWWWRAGLDGYRDRAKWVATPVQLFFAFMFFNATIVFGGRFMQWFGVASMLVLAVVAASRSRHSGARS